VWVNGVTGASAPFQSGFAPSNGVSNTLGGPPDVVVTTNASTGTSYISGKTSSYIIFPEVYANSTWMRNSMTICTVSRYSPLAGAFKRRLVNSYTNNLWHGHYNGYSGTATYGGRNIPELTEGGPFVTPLFSQFSTQWVSLCTTMNTNATGGTKTNAVASSYQGNVNGRYCSGNLLMFPPDQITLNLNYFYYGPENLDIMDTERTTFDVGEIMTWNRALSAAELTQVQNYLGAKFGVAMPPPPPAPPSPPSPSPPSPSPPQPPSPPPPNSGLLASSLISWGQSLTGGGTQLSSWTGVTACSGLTASSWLGITCTGGVPTAVVLAKQGLSGNISCAVATVTTLTSIDLVRARASAPVMHLRSRS
jgi:hypothetical protein